MLHGFSKQQVKGFFNDAYVEQLNAYRICRVNEFPDKDIGMKLDMFHKDQNPLKNDVAYEELTIPVLTDFKQTAVDRTNELEDALLLGETPDECSDLWFRSAKKGEAAQPTRCINYCGVKDICPHFRERVLNPMSSVNKNKFNW